MTTKSILLGILLLIIAGLSLSLIYQFVVFAVRRYRARNRRGD